MKRIAKYFLLFLVGTSFVNDPSACSCVAASTAEHFKDADVVFTGEVLEVIDLSARAGTRFSSSDPIFAIVKIQRSWKGIKEQKTAIIRTVLDSVTCGVEFEVGQQYLIFGDYDMIMGHFLADENWTKTNRKNYNFFLTHRCAGTRETKYLEGELKELDKLISAR